MEAHTEHTEETAAAEPVISTEEAQAASERAAQAKADEQPAEGSVDPEVARKHIEQIQGNHDVVQPNYIETNFHDHPFPDGELSHFKEAEPHEAPKKPWYKRMLGL